MFFFFVEVIAATVVNDFSNRLSIAKIRHLFRSREFTIIIRVYKTFTFYKFNNELLRFDLYMTKPRERRTISD